MLDKIILFSIRNKFIIGLLTAAFALLGLYSLSHLPIDALPDITNNQVQIITSSPTLATQEVEQFITYPIEQAMKPIPRVVELRSLSRFGLSVVTVVFEKDVDIYWARTQISERIKEAENQIPKGLGAPEMSPISTGLGEIYQYVVSPKKGFEDKFDAMELRTIQDWIIRPQLIGTKGVAEVNTLGGFLKQYEIAVQPDKLKGLQVSMSEVFEALEKNNENTGGAYIDKKPYAYFIRGIGMVNSMGDIEKIVVKTHNGVPVLIRDVATVQKGSSIRYGAVTKDGNGEEVSGMVMMLKGENSAEVVSEVKAKMEQIKKSLPEGVEIEAFMDRTKLVEKSIGTVRNNLIEGALIVIFILILLLGNWRAGLVVASVIPLALLFAVTMMHLFGVSGNLMSLGAIDFGLIVDGAVIIVEAIIHRLQHVNKGKLDADQMDEEVYTASAQIRSSAAFGEIIILIVYLPILALVGIEGKMFKPMAQTVSFAILGAFILSLTYVPMASALFLSKQTGHTKNFSDRIMEAIYKVYRPFLEKCFQVKGLVVGVAIYLLLVAIFVFTRMGGEFIPTLDEGDIATHLIVSSGSSLSQEVEATTQAEKILKDKFPEINMIVTKIGSAEIPTDPMPIEAGDMIITLKDRSEWTSASTKEELMEKMEHELNSIPGVFTEFSQPIQMRFNELMTGVRSDVAVKIFGEDIDMLVSKGDEVLQLIQGVQGVSDAKAERVSGLPQISVRYNKDKMAAFGLNVAELNRVIRMGFAGEAAGVVYEGEKRFDMVVRLAQESRQDISNLKSLSVSLPNGNTIPMEQVADITFEPGPQQISRENGKRRITVGFNVRGRDVKSVVEEIQGILDAKLKLPAGYYTTFGGQFENLVAANKRLSVAVPVALALIFVLLFFTFRSVKQSILIFTAIPLSAIGGVFALWLRDMPFSISAGVGFIALFGVAVLNGIVLIGYFNQLKTEGISDVLERIKEGTKVRLRPVVMTASVASFGFLPMALGHGAGAEVQKPLATVVIGGLITATLLTLIVLPILYYYFENNTWKKTLSNKLKAGLGVLALMVSLPLYEGLNAQTPVLTLPQAIELALKNNLQIQAEQINIQLHSQLKGTSKEMPKTNIVAMLGQYNTRQFDQNYTISQGFSPFLIKAKSVLLEQNQKQAELKKDMVAQELVFQIRQSWNSILYYRSINETLQREDSLMQQFARAVALRFKTGETGVLESQITFAKKEEIRQQLVNNQSFISIEKLKLLQLLNQKEAFELSEKKLAVLDGAFLGEADILEKNPLLQLALQEVKTSEAQKTMHQAELKPEFSAGYFLQSLTGPQEVNNQVIYYNGAPRFQGVTLGVSVPLLGRGANKAKVESANTNILLQQKNAESRRQTLQSLYNQEILLLEVNKNHLAYFQKTAIPNARLIVESASKAYSNGDIDYIEYLQAFQTASETQRKYTEAILKHNQSIINIQFLINQ